MKLKDRTAIVDDNGKQVGIILKISEYEKMLEELEELESIRAFDRAKAGRDKAIPFGQAIKEIEKQRR